MEINSSTSTYPALVDNIPQEKKALTLEIKDIKDKEDVKQAIRVINQLFKTFCQ